VFEKSTVHVGIEVFVTNEDTGWRLDNSGRCMILGNRGIEKVKIRFLDFWRHSLCVRRRLHAVQSQMFSVGNEMTPETFK
jgi:hypothetical protein